ncbi:unnamed protein product, partial [Coregonus sp. 'balchen']
MPFIDLESNLPASKFSEEFLKKLGYQTAAILGKPEERMMLVVKPGLPMLMGGTCAPCVILSVSAIGVTDTADRDQVLCTGATSGRKGRNCYELPVGGTMDDRVTSSIHSTT